jgi:hypothetical protein
LDYDYSAWKRPLAGGPSVELAANAGRRQAIFVDDAAIMWSVNEHASGNPHFGSVWRLPKE